MKKCRTTSKNKIFIFSEKRSHLTLKNADAVKSTKILIDGCEINDDGIRCDYLHLAKDIEMYIELKGQDLVHAMNQIKRTIGLLGAQEKTQKRICYIICTRCPITSTQIQIYDRQFRSKFNSKLIIRSSPFTDTY